MKLCVPRFGLHCSKGFRRMKLCVFFARAPFGPGGLVAECIEP